MQQVALRSRTIGAFFFFVSCFLTISFKIDAQATVQLPAHIVIEVIGDVSINREEWNDDIWEPVTVGLNVRSKDRINPHASGQVIVLCANLKIDLIVKTRRTPDCGGDVEPPRFPIPITDVRSVSIQADSLYLISPRQRILNRIPAFRWTSISGAASYSITILRSSSLVFTESGIVDTTFIYPGNLDPALYTVTITAFNSANSEITDNARTPNSFTVVDASAEGFTDFSDVQMPDVRTPEMLVYAKAMYYADFGLYSEAIDLLAPYLATSAQSNPLKQSPFIYWQFGNWHVALNLLNEAEDVLNIGMKVAVQQQSEFSKALIHESLSKVYQAPETIVYHLEEARSFYENIGDLSRVAELSIAIEKNS